MNNAETIENWKDDADQIGIDMNTVWTQWNHTKALITALERSPRATEHHESFYLRTFVFKAVVDQVILGIRRQVDEDKRAHSLVNFLNGLIAQPAVYSLDECIATFLERAGTWSLAEPMRSQYEAQARALYGAVADDSGIALNPTTIRKDLIAVRKICRNMEKIANKHVAHNDRHKPQYNLTIAEVDDAISQVKGLIRKYCRLFDGGGAGGEEPNLEEMLSLYHFAWLEETATVPQADKK